MKRFFSQATRIDVPLRLLMLKTFDVLHLSHLCLLRVCHFPFFILNVILDMSLPNGHSREKEC